MLEPTINFVEQKPTTLSDNLTLTEVVTLLKRKVNSVLSANELARTSLIAEEVKEINNLIQTQGY